MTELHDRVTSLDGSAGPWDGLVVHDHGAPVLATRADALRAARTLAADWAVSGPARDRDRQVPRAELEALSRSGLLGVTVPASYGGPGGSTRTLTDVFAILSAADTSLAQVPQNHFGTVYSLPGIDEERRAFWYAETLRGARFGNANAETGRSSRTNPGTRIRDAVAADPDLPGGGRPAYVLHGTKRFATGALTADWITVGLAHEDGWKATAMVPAGTAGVTALEDWTAFGQRSTFSGTVEFDHVGLHAAHVIDHRDQPRENAAFRYSRSQLTHSALQVGSTEGALAQALAWHSAGRIEHRARFEAWYEEVSFEVAAARALVGRAADLIDELAARLDAGLPLDPDRVMALGVAVDESKVLAYELGPASADGLARLAPDADAVAEADRRWRNARTHALHDPVRWRRHYVAAYHLRGEFLPHAQWLQTSATAPQ